MKNVSYLAAATILVSCSPEPRTAGILSPDELTRARSVPSTGDAVMVSGGREFVGGAMIGINATSETVVLTLVGYTTDSMRDGMNGLIRLPNELARQLASSGWDFTIQLNPDAMDADPSVAYVNGPTLTGYVPTSLEISAEPGGLFVGVVQLVNRAGTTDTIELYGRLVAGCETGTESSGTMMVADPSTIPLCDDIMREL